VHDIDRAAYNFSQPAKPLINKVSRAGGHGLEFQEAHGSEGSDPEFKGLGVLGYAGKWDRWLSY